MSTQHRLSIVVESGNSLQVIQQLRQALSGLGTQGRASVDAVSRLGNQSQSTQSVIRQFTQNITNLTQNTTNMGNTVNRTTQSIRNMNSTVGGTTNTVNNMSHAVGGATNSINNMGGAVGNASTAFGGLQGALAGVLGGFSALSVLKIADDMQNMHAQIRLVTQSTEEYQAVASRLHDMAMQNYTDVEATTQLYTNSARALGNLGKSQEEVLQFTNAVSLAMGVGGKSAQEQASAIMQLGQAMQSGVLQGDEFRSLSENAPIMLDLVAKSLGKTRAEVRALASDGKISSEVIFNALSGATDELKAQFDSMPVTMGQAFGLISNQYKKFVHEMMNGTGGMSEQIAKGLTFIAKHFDNLATIGIAGAGVALLLFANRVLTVGTVLSRLAVIMKAHPLMAIASVIIGVSVATRGFDTTMKDLSDSLKVLGMILKDVMGYFKDLGVFAIEMFDAITMSAENSNQKNKSAFGGFFDDVGSGFQGFLVGTAKVFDAIAVLVRTTAQMAGQYMGAFVIGVQNAFARMANSIREVFEFVINSVIVNAINTASSKLNDFINMMNGALSSLGVESQIGQIAQVGQVSLGRSAVLQQQMPEWGKTFDENAERQKGSGFQSYVQGKFDELKKMQNGLKNSQVDLTKVTKEAIQKQNENKGKSEKAKKEKEKKGEKNAGKYHLPKHVQDAILWGASQLGVNANDLAAVISFETSGTFRTNIRNSGSSATGLIQFMEDADGKRDGRYYGMSRDQFGALSHMEQMKYVVQFLKKKGIKAGAGVGAIYDAVAGYGYRIGTKAYEQNRVWDVNRNGIVEKGEAVTGEKFRKHIKNYFGNGVSASRLGEIDDKVFRDEQKQLEELQRLRDDVKARYFSESEKMLEEHQKNVAEIQKTMSGEEMQRYLKLENERFALLKQSLDAEKKLKDAQIDEQLHGWKDSEEQKIKRKLELAKLEIQANKELNDTLKQQAMTAIDEQMAHELHQFQETQQAKLLQIQQPIHEQLAQSQQNMALAQAKKQLSPHGFEQWNLQNDYSTAITGAWNGYQANLKQINQQDEHGNYALQDEQRKQAILSAERLFQEQKLAIEQEFAEKSKALQQQNHDSQIQAYATIFGNLTGMTKGFFGEQSGIYRAMFAMEKGFAIANAVLAMKQNIAEAMKLGFPANIPMIAAATSQGMAIVNDVRSIMMPSGMAHSGIDYIPSEGTWLLDKGERVLSPRQNRDLTQFLQGNHTGGVVINQTIHIHSNGESQIEQDKHNAVAEGLKVAMIKVVQNEMRQGGSIYRFVKG